MGSIEDPGISTLIADIRTLDIKQRLVRAEKESKKIALKELDKQTYCYSSMWKRLFLSYHGAPINELLFVKACASSDLKIKKCAYLGLANIESAKHRLIMTNTIVKDLGNPETERDALTFISNAQGTEQLLCEVKKNIVIPNETNELFPLATVAKAKLETPSAITMSSKTEKALFIKLQIVLDDNLIGCLEKQDIQYLQDKVFNVCSKHVRLKILQCLVALNRRSLGIIGERLFIFLKELIIGTATQSVRQIDVAIALESCKLLYETGNVCEKAEAFIYRLINSENPNSRFLAFNFAVQYNVFTELIVEKIIRLGACDTFHLSVLKQLINRGNYRRIYSKREEIMHYVLKGVINPPKATDGLKQIIIRIAELADAEFLSRIIYENPEIYSEIRSRKLIDPAQTKPLLKMALGRNEITFFSLIYDLLPASSQNTSIVGLLIDKHLPALIDGIFTNKKKELLNTFFDILCTHGNIEFNRDAIIEIYCRTDKNNKDLLCALASGILLFNVVLNDYCVLLPENGFVICKVENNMMTVKYPQWISLINISNEISNIEFFSETTKDYLTERKYCVSEVKSLVLNVCQGIQKYLIPLSFLEQGILR